MPPKGPITIAKNTNGGTGCIIPVNPATIQPQQPRSAARLKLEIRRLPPALSQDEFEQAFGDEWKKGAGKVDWVEYRQGKTKSPGKHPEQSRVYLHLTHESHVKAFEAKFLSVTFHDAKGTYKDPSLKSLPPTLGFAPIQRIPVAKARVDGRQGTIDQDPEYMAFLEGETQPVQKPSALDNANVDKTKEAVTTTPLIEALREKKANKEKAKAAKSAKREDPKDDKGTEKVVSKRGGKGAQVEVKTATKTESPAKDVAKVSGRQSSKAATAAVTPDAAPATSSPSGFPAPNRKRERAPASIKSVLQRDLGLTPAPRRAAKQATPVDGTTPAAQPTPTGVASGNVPSTVARSGKPPRQGRETAVVETPNGQIVQQQPGASPTPLGGVKKPATAQNTVKSSRGRGTAANPIQTTPPVTSSEMPKPALTTTKAAKPAPQPSPGAMKAYLKHANASQGITEPLLMTALSAFGEVVSVEIDKRKGTALAQLKDHETLKILMAKRSIPVAQGAVEVHEYKEKTGATGARGSVTAGRGGGTRGRGRGGVARAGAAVSTANISTPKSASATDISKPSATSTPSAEPT